MMISSVFKVKAVPLPARGAAFRAGPATSGKFGRLPLLFFAGLFSLALSSGVFAGEGAPQAPADEKKEDTGQVLAARVNGTPITKNDLMKMVILMKSQIQAGGPQDQMKLIMDEALNRLIFQELAYQKAKAEGLKVDEKKIDEVIANLKLNKGEEGFRKLLEEEQATEGELRRRSERSFLIQQIYRREVKDKAVVPEEEARAEYEKEKEKYTMPEKISVTDVVLFLPLDDSSIKEAEKVLEAVRKEKDRDPRKVTESDLFIVKDADLTPKDKELYEGARKLKVGELSGLIKTSDSFHILKLNKYVPLKQFSFEEVKAPVLAKLSNEVRRRRLKAWEAELKKGANIEIFNLTAGEAGN